MPSRGQPSLPPTTSVQGHLARTTILLRDHQSDGDQRQCAPLTVPSYGDSSWGARDYRRSPRMFRIGDASTFTQTHGSSGPVRCEFIHGMAIATRPAQEGGCCAESWARPSAGL